MDITTEAEALFDNHPRRKNKALLLDIAIVNPCASSNLENAARHAGKRLADAVERRKNKYRGSFPATYSLFSLAMSTCGEVSSDVHALIKELAIRGIDQRSEIHSNESRHLAEGTKVARLRRRFSFVLQQALSLRTRRHIFRQGAALAITRQLNSQGPVSVHAHRTEGVTGSEGREEAKRVGGGIGAGGGNGDGDGNGVGGENGGVNDCDGDKDGAGMKTEVEANEGTQVGNGDRSGDGAGTETRTGVKIRGRTQDGNGDWSGDGNESSGGDRNGDGNEDGIGEGGREAKKR